MPTTSKAFVDTNVFVATRNENDPTHKKAIRLFDYLKKNSIQLYTSSDVIGETLTVMSKKLGKAIAADWFNDYKKSEVKEIFVDEDIHEEARNLFFQVRSKNISFIDCSSAVAMKKNKINVIFTFDEHFKKLGVRLLGEAVKN